MKANNSRKVGDVHSNGKWAWTEYSKGKFDWRTIKTQSTKAKEPKVEEPKLEEPKSEEPKVEEKVAFKNKKSFINGTKHDLTKEECKLWYNKFGKETDIRVCNRWSYLMGRIGSCSTTIENSKTGKSKDFEKHPNWRPLTHYSYSVNGWNGDFIEIEGYCQSWEEIRKSCSETESMTFFIQKHPHQ